MFPRARPDASPARIWHAFLDRGARPGPHTRCIRPPHARRLPLQPAPSDDTLDSIAAFLHLGPPVTLLASFKLAKRVLLETDKRLLWTLAYNMGFKGALSVHRHKLRLKTGQVFPPFLYVSIINTCNLRCQGCWVDVSMKQETIKPEAFHKLVREAKQMGNVFFGIVGGEPFMHPHLLDMLAEHPDCYFQIFTNGHFITPERAKQMWRLGNVTPLVSVEGTEIVSDERRGRGGVLNKTMQGLHNALDAGVFTGVCTSLARTNIDDLLREAWIDRLVDMGVLYTWFHVYRPMGPNPNPDLCLTPEQALRARTFVVEMRAKKPIVIIDAYHDGEGKALCPAATGISHHINPWGDIEPCPIVQFSKESIHGTTDARPLKQKFLQSAFLADFRKLAAETTRGCIVLERPDLLKKLVAAHGAKDATARQTALAELGAMTVRTSQYNPAAEVPEKNVFYRLAKRLFFNDFGAYAGHDAQHAQASAPAVLAK
ncbi:astB/chuR-related protein-putative enzyme of the MoaA / nifB / pqqE family [Frigoriglobus tundricola]|uniref:AstB/chuR-related protein-putative enzyme of the MoaA / nifB / pqqE family n=1 Tax=Frigoriglobus tundricola TaxID=2774151 RepID=A0A6M5YLN2_9BACT|nr:astB/chuR-related protein-putative enzyme of the MoaA / nifB / pqqE family [Frigoriglobus tundricola]